MGALEAIRKHAGIADSSSIFARTTEHRLSTISFISVGDSCSVPRYVLKRPSDCARHKPWSPLREFDNTRQLHDASSASNIMYVAEPVAFGEDPPFLITRFIPGTSLETIIKSGCRRFATPARRAAAVHACRVFGEWVGEKLRLTTRPASPLEFADYRAFCEERLVEIADFYGKTGERVSKSVSSWLDRLGDSSSLGDCFPMTNEYARQFDCNPQNFILSDDGQLWGIDFDSLRYAHLLVDPCAFKLWLEQMLTNVIYSPTSIRSCWLAFAPHGAKPDTAVLLSYVHTLLADIAWQRNPDRLRAARDSSLARARKHFLASRRFAYLSHLCAHDTADDETSNHLLSL
jgi:hypothetical protein